MPMMLGDPLDSVAERDLGSQLLPANNADVAGAVAGQAFDANPIPRIVRSFNRIPDSASPDDLGLPGIDTPTAPVTPLMSPDEANRRYGMPGGEAQGGLTFTAPTSERVASSLYDEHRTAALRADTIARGEGTFAAGFAGRNLIGLATGLLDPVNLAAGFIPGIGEARFASLLNEGALARAAAGATAGAAQMAALEPLNALFDSQEHNDWSMAQALRDIAFGGLIGGGLHVLGGAFNREPVPGANPITDRMEAAGFDARDMALRGGLAQTLDGRAVDVAPALDLVDTAREPALEAAPGATLAPGDVDVAPNAPVPDPIDPLAAAAPDTAATDDRAARATQDAADLTQVARARVDHPDDAPSDRAAAALRARAPEISADPVKRLAEETTMADRFAQQVQTEIAAGRLTEEDATELTHAVAAADRINGQAKAYEAATACLMQGMA